MKVKVLPVVADGTVKYNVQVKNEGGSYVAAPEIHLKGVETGYLKSVKSLGLTINHRLSSLEHGWFPYGS